MNKENDPSKHVYDQGDEVTQPEEAVENQRPRFNRRSFLAGAGVMALIAAGLTLGIETASWDGKMSRYATQEQALVGKWQRHGLTEEKASFLFGPGVTYRTTPDLINHSSTDIPWLNGNQAGTVAKDSVMIVKDPIELKQPDGITWLGFEQNNGSVNRSSAKLSEAQIANEIFWIDYSAVEGQKQNGQPLVTSVFASGTQHGKINPNGQIVESNGTPAAYAFDATQSQYQEFKNFFKG